jgi:translation elongation factor EF-1alpha
MIKEEYIPSYVYANSILECLVMDFPTINKFFSSSKDEWQNNRHFGLRSADAYLLVHDVSMPYSFHFLQCIRDQIAMSRGLGAVRIVVSANKTDLVKDDLTQDYEREVSRTKNDIITKVKNAWKLNLIQCSVKHNWNLNTVFKELAA